MRKEEKYQIIESLSEKLKNSDVIYLADTSGLNVETINGLRRMCFRRNVSMQVVKNTLLKKAMEKSEKDFEPLFEALVGFVFWLFIHRAGYQFSIETAIILFIVLLALTLSLSDYYYQIIPDEFLIIMFSLGLYLNYLTLNEHIIGILGGTTIFLLLHYLSRGRAMGYGDVKLVFVMAVILPSFYLAWSLYLAFLTGGIISVILILLTRKKLKSTISFGPFLGFGLVSLLWFLV